jgi:hypothetical protein
MVELPDLEQNAAYACKQYHMHMLYFFSFLIIRVKLAS